MAASISRSCFLSKAIDFREISKCLIFVRIVCDSLNQMDASTQLVMYTLVTVNFCHVYCTVDACVEHSLFVFRITQIELSVCSRDTHVWKRKKTQSRLFFFKLEGSFQQRFTVYGCVDLETSFMVLSDVCQSELSIRILSSPIAIEYQWSFFSRRIS